MSQKYQYVTHREYSPVNQNFQPIMDRVRADVKTLGITFQHHLIGSGNRRLVTRIVGGNQGFDFDYDFDIQQFPDGYGPKEIKDLFRESFRRALEDTGYGDPEDSTSVLTIKMVDSDNDMIIHSFDIALTFRFEDGERYIRNNRNGTYTWECRRSGGSVTELVDEIEDFYVDGWGLIRDEYLDVKNHNRNPYKRSYSLYLEAVHNVSNMMHQDPDYPEYERTGNQRR